MFKRATQHLFAKSSQKFAKQAPIAQQILQAHSVGGVATHKQRSFTKQAIIFKQQQKASVWKQQTRKSKQRTTTKTLEELVPKDIVKQIQRSQTVR